MQKLKVKDNTMDKVESRLKHNELMAGQIDMIPEEAPFMNKFQLNSNFKAPKLPSINKNK